MSRRTATNPAPRKRPVPTGGANQGVEKLFQNPNQGRHCLPRGNPVRWMAGTYHAFGNTVDRRRAEWAI